jgi:hypothetical protein
LPPDPPVSMADPLQELLSQADRALGRLDGSVQTLPHPDLSVAMYVRTVSPSPKLTQSEVEYLTCLSSRGTIDHYL